MHTFTDAKKREWQVGPFKIGSIKRIREMAKVDLLETGTFDEWLNDIVRCCDVLWAAVYPFCKAADVTYDDFTDNIAPEPHLRDAVDALLKETQDFFCRLKPPQEDEIRAAFAPIFGGLSTSGPDTSESPPPTSLPSQS